MRFAYVRFMAQAPDRVRAVAPDQRKRSVALGGRSRRRGKSGGIH